MKYLADTSVMLRWSHADSTNHDLCARVVANILTAGDCPCICAQVLIEFRCVSTRPRDVNGLGISASEAAGRTADLRSIFTCLPEPPDIADRWEVLVNKYSVIGKPCHDTRLVALMLAHGVTHLLTLNPTDFARYSEITAVTPQEIH